MVSQRSTTGQQEEVTRPYAWQDESSFQQSITIQHNAMSVSKRFSSQIWFFFFFLCVRRSRYRLYFLLWAIYKSYKIPTSQFCDAMSPLYLAKSLFETRLFYPYMLSHNFSPLLVYTGDGVCFRASSLTYPVCHAQAPYLRPLTPPYLSTLPHERHSLWKQLLSIK
jgi:hypothetical protein